MMVEKVDFYDMDEQLKQQLKQIIIKQNNWEKLTVQEAELAEIYEQIIKEKKFELLGIFVEEYFCTYAL